MKLRLAALMIVLGIAVVAAGCQRAAQPPAREKMAGETQVVNVVAKEFAFEPKEIMVKAGMVKFAVQNAGAIEHDFEVAGVAEHGAEHAQKLFKPGETYQTALQLRPGTYEVVCNVPGHKEAGMTATITVE